MAPARGSQCEQRLNTSRGIHTHPYVGHWLKCSAGTLVTLAATGPRRRLWHGEPPPPTSPRRQHPQPPRGLLSVAAEAPGRSGHTCRGSCPWKGSHGPGKEERHPPGTRRSPAPLPSLPSCGCAGAADGGCTRSGRREYKGSARAFRSCRNQIIPLSPVDANTAVMAVVSLFPVLPAGVPTSLPGRGASVLLF